MRHIKKPLYLNEYLENVHKICLLGDVKKDIAVLECIYKYLPDVLLYSSEELPVKLKYNNFFLQKYDSGFIKCNINNFLALKKARFDAVIYIGYNRPRYEIFLELLICLSGSKRNIVHQFPGELSDITIFDCIFFRLLFPLCKKVIGRCLMPLLAIRLKRRIRKNDIYANSN